MPVNPFLQSLLVGVARAGVRAGVAALDSVLRDAEELTEEATGRVKRTRAKARKLVDRDAQEQEPVPQVIRINVKQRKAASSR
jgi:hypothetical protein